MLETTQHVPRRKSFMHGGPLRRAIGILTAGIVRREIKAGRTDW